MEDYEELAWTSLDQPPAPRRRGRRWLLIGGLALAFMLALGIGTVIGSLTGITRAAALTQSSASSGQTLTFSQGNSNGAQTLNNAPGNFNDPGAFGAAPGANGPCEALTVSSVSGNTIVAKRQAAVLSRFIRQQAPATPRPVKLSPRAPSLLAPTLASWERITAMAASLLPASTLDDSTSPFLPLPNGSAVVTDARSHFFNKCLLEDVWNGLPRL